MADAEAEELTRQENLAYFQRIEQMLNEPEEDEVSLPPCGHWPIPIPLTRSIAPTCARSTGVIQPQPASRAAVGGEAKRKCSSAVAAIRPPPPLPGLRCQQVWRGSGCVSPSSPRRL